MISPCIFRTVEPVGHSWVIIDPLKRKKVTSGYLFILYHRPLSISFLSYVGKPDAARLCRLSRLVERRFGKKAAMGT